MCQESSESNRTSGLSLRKERAGLVLISVKVSLWRFDCSLRAHPSACRSSCHQKNKLHNSTRQQAQIKSMGSEGGANQPLSLLAPPSPPPPQPRPKRCRRRAQTSNEKTRRRISKHSNYTIIDKRARHRQGRKGAKLVGPRLSVSLMPLQVAHKSSLSLLFSSLLGRQRELIGADKR